MSLPIAPILGLHHVTALVKDAARCRKFYSEVLGLRMVKRTVNFDDPGSYHLYFGDRTGTPGTVVTFFPHPKAAPTKPGTREICAVSLAVPVGSLDRWAKILGDAHVECARDELHGEHRLSFRDPDGMALALVETAHTELSFTPWPQSPTPPDVAICRLHGVAFRLDSYDATARLLTGRLGFRATREDRGRFRFHVAEGGPGKIIDLIATPDGTPAVPGAGSVHHVALRVDTPDDQLEVREDVASAGLHVTPVLDRTYFRSIYFREPGGIILEVATDGPGFTADEPEDTLGEALRLPAQHEHLRERLERELPPLD